MRNSVRGVLLTPEGKILMMKFREPVSKNEFWATPGGGVKTEESFESALLRELKEETDKGNFPIGPKIWVREFSYTWGNRPVTQREHFYLIESNEFVPKMLHNPSSGEAKAFQEFRWWFPWEIKDSNEHFGPDGIADLVASLSREGIPETPVDLGKSG